MRRMLSTALTWGITAAVLLVPAVPALAQETGGGSKPWHYWVAPVLLAGGVLVLVAIGVGYWIRVMGGRARR